VRVCNLRLPVISLAGNVYRYGDYEGVVGALAKTGEIFFPRFIHLDTKIP
jgi:hypothetical protein